MMMVPSYLYFEYVAFLEIPASKLSGNCGIVIASVDLE